MRAVLCRHQAGARRLAAGQQHGERLAQIGQPCAMAPGDARGLLLLAAQALLGQLAHNPVGLGLQRRVSSTSASVTQAGARTARPSGRR